MSLWLIGKLPFKEVFLHPIIKDALGRKMSKSLGNIIDPLEIIEGTTLEQLLLQIRDSNLSQEEQEKSIKAKKKVNWLESTIKKI